MPKKKKLMRACLVESTVDAYSGSTHERVRSRGTRRVSLQHLLRGADRLVRGTGQTGRRAE